jgi:hypothetical protein
MALAGNVKIAGDYTINDWKTLKKHLPTDTNPNNNCWHEAFNIFELRVKTRFLNPINTILQMYPKKGRGEGFSAVALQCILIEFFEAFYQGKIYNPDKDNLKENEYRTCLQFLH